MKILNFLTEFLLIAIIVTIVSALVGFLYDLIFHGTSSFDWIGAIRMGIIFGIIFPAINSMDRYKKTRK